MFVVSAANLNALGSYWGSMRAWLFPIYEVTWEQASHSRSAQTVGT